MHDVWDDGHEYSLPFIKQYSANCFAPLYCGPARSRDWKISKIEILRKADYTVKLERLINRCGKGSTAEDDPHNKNKVQSIFAALSNCTCDSMTDLVKL